ncbi:MAG: HD domain-containing protein [Pyrinomonadaceae bacterium]|nr:HD domain-containing protein [Pyrinomonadaceae bacterium]
MSFSEFKNPPESSVDAELWKLAIATDEFEGYAHPHASRIAIIADEVAQLFNLAPHDRFSLRQAALVHDLGEAVMNRDYIKRSSVLTEEERLDLMRHPVIGEQEAAKKGLDRAVQLTVRWHQEWWNGEGYPDGLRREQIPLTARILRVVDAYAALTDHRPHSPAVSVEDARLHLKQWAGLEFDPKVVWAFLSLPAIDELQSFSDLLPFSSENQRLIEENGGW